MPAFPDADLTRRAVLSAGVSGAAAVVLAGCSSGGGSDGPNPAPRPAQPSLEPDVAVATTALQQIRSVRIAADATVRRFPALHTGLAPVVAMHGAHEASLVDAVPKRATASTDPAPYTVPARRAVALSKLSAAETRLHSSLDGLALSAQSGEFARLLAAMGAAVGQRVSGWPT